jgi:hypothetical protein
MKRTWIKRACATLLAVCLAAGIFSQAIQVNTLQVEAAAKVTDSQLNKKVKSVIKKSKVKKSDDNEVKLKKLFKYVENKYKYSRSSLAAAGSYKGWQKDYAYEMYKKKKGTCYHDAAAFAYLAKAATGYPVKVAIGKTNGFSKQRVQPHSWVEIKIDGKWYVCDTSLDRYIKSQTGESGTYFLAKKSSVKKVYNKFKNTTYVTIK